MALCADGRSGGVALAVRDTEAAATQGDEGIVRREVDVSEWAGSGADLI
jgi:hypothetical protein